MAQKRKYGSVKLSSKVYQRLRLAATGAIRRCTDPRYKLFKNYGGRGIKVYKPWIENPEKFITYLATLEGYDDPELVLDREDNDGNYRPGNLRFITRVESNINRRLNLRIGRFF